MTTCRRTDLQEDMSRLRWQCRRGMLELDLLLQPFVEQHYQHLPVSQQQAFRQLLSYPDQELLGYLMGEQQPGNKDVADVAEKIRRAAAG